MNVCLGCNRRELAESLRMLGEGRWYLVRECEHCGWTLLMLWAVAEEPAA